MELEGKVLITGGAGFLGRAIMARARKESWDCEFTIFSRDEQKQAQAAKKFGSTVRCVLGDIRDTNTLQQIAVGHDVVIHAAALKYIPEAEFNVNECVSVNVAGSQSVIRACQGIVETVLAVSTDKAVEPLNIYGATKMAMERLFVEADSRSADTDFLVVRYGNVIGSTGSVIPVFAEQAERVGELTLTDQRMTRFWLTPDEAVDIVLHTIEQLPCECIVIPKARSMELVALAEALFPGVPRTVVGLRPGEKMHESLLSQYEAVKAASDPDGQDQYVYFAPLGGPQDEPVSSMSSATASRMSAEEMVAAVVQAQEI